MRVIIADDSVLLREGLSRILVEAGFEVTAQVGDAAALLAAVDADPPDACIVDIRMPPTNSTEGLEAAMVLRDRHPRIAVLLLSQYVETHYAMQLLANGAAGVGYLLKDRVGGVGELVAALRTVAIEGGTVMDGLRIAGAKVRQLQMPNQGKTRCPRPMRPIEASSNSSCGPGACPKRPPPAPPRS